jgi:hypothetical protein
VNWRRILTRRTPPNSSTSACSLLTANSTGQCLHQVTSINAATHSTANRTPICNGHTICSSSRLSTTTAAILVESTNSHPVAKPLLRSPARTPRPHLRPRSRMRRSRHPSRRARPVRGSVRPNAHWPPSVAQELHANLLRGPRPFSDSRASSSHGGTSTVGKCTATGRAREPC